MSIITRHNLLNDKYGCYPKCRYLLVYKDKQQHFLLFNKSIFFEDVTGCNNLLFPIISVKNSSHDKLQLTFNTRIALTVSILNFM